jgi:aryl carrier-like protein
LPDLSAAPLPAKATDVAGIVRQLEEDIVLWRLLPRERLVEDALMARFGAKRHQVRSALDALQRMGLVERLRNRGVQVRHYDDAETIALLNFRTLIEPAAVAEMSLPPAPEAMERLRAIQDRHDAACEAGDLAAVFRSTAACSRCAPTRSWWRRSIAPPCRPMRCAFPPCRTAPRWTRPGATTTRCWRRWRAAMTRSCAICSASTC